MSAGRDPDATRSKGAVDEDALLPTVAGSAAAERGESPGSATGPGGEVQTASHDVTRVGRFVVVRKLGSGGMGTVYAAYDDQLDRKVAIKLLAVGDEDTVRQSARLRREAQALARLNHPNVVSVYEVGEHDGQVFLAMEFIDGATLRSWADAHERSWRDVLDSFVQAGRGLSAAHAAGLVHRDFKPENVLVGHDGRVRVLDFGLARPTDSSVETEELEARSGVDPLHLPLTRAGAIVGTPAYMAPEQFAGAATDSRTDQFGFCVSLFECLYGARPFPHQLPALAHAVVHEDPQIPPGRRSVPNRVERAVLRGLAKQPEGRWPTMDALLRELEGAARPRQRRIAIAVGIGVIGVGAWALASSQDSLCTGAAEKWSDVWDAVKRDQIALTFAGTGVTYSEEASDRVATSLDDYVTRWTAAHTDACEATQVRGEQSTDLLDLRIECLERRLVETEALLDVFATADTTVVLHAIEAVAGLPAIERCSDTGALRAQIPPPDDAATASAVAELTQSLAHVHALEAAGRYSESLDAARAAAIEAEGVGYAPISARAVYWQGVLEARSGDYEGARASLANAYWESVANRDDENAIDAGIKLVFVVGERLAKLDEGLLWARNADALIRRAGGGKPAAQLADAVGTVLLRHNRHREALESLERAAQILEHNYGPDDPVLAVTLNNMGAVYRAMDELEAAKRALERSLELRESQLGPNHPHVSAALQNLSGVLWGLGELEAARRSMERVLAIDEGAFGPKHPEVAKTRGNYALVLKAMGDNVAALSLLERALVDTVAALGEDHPDVGMRYLGFGSVHFAMENYPMAELAYRRAAEIYGDGPDHALALRNLAQVLRRLDRTAEARSPLERALAALPPDHPLVAGTLDDLAKVLDELGNDDLAKRYRARSKALTDRASRDSP